MEQGFSAGSVLEHGVPRVAMHPHPVPHTAPHVGAHPQNPNIVEGAAKGAAVGNQARRPSAAELATQQQMAGWHGIKSKAMMPVNLEFGGMAGGGLLGMLGFQRARAVVRMAKVPAHALRNTTIAESFHLGANAVKAAGTEVSEVLTTTAEKAAKPLANATKKLQEAQALAAETKAAALATPSAKSTRVAEKAATKATKAAAKLAKVEAKPIKPVDVKMSGIAESLETRSATMAEKAATRQTDFVGSRFVTGLRTHVGNAIERVESATGMGDRLKGFVANRKIALAEKHTDILANARGALTAERSGFAKVTGSIGSGIGKVFGRAPAVSEGAHHLSGIIGQLEQHAADPVKLKATQQELSTLMTNGAFKGEAAYSAKQVAKHAGKLVNNATALTRYGTAAEGGLKTLVKAMGGKVGSVKLLYPVLAVAAYAGYKAVKIAANAESAQVKDAYNDLAGVIGKDDTAGFLVALKAEKKAANSGIAKKTGLKAANEVLEAATMGMMGGGFGGGEAIFAASAMPTALEHLVDEHPALGAWTALRMSDKGEIQLSADDRAKAILQLHAVEPVTAAHAGIYCRMAQANAQEMVARNYTAEQIAHVLANKAAMTQLSAEVTEKLKAPAVAPVSEAAQHTPASKAEEAYAKIEKPAGRIVTANDNTITANDNGKAELQGRISGAALQRA